MIKTDGIGGDRASAADRKHVLAAAAFQTPICSTRARISPTIRGGSNELPAFAAADVRRPGAHSLRRRHASSLGRRESGEVADWIYVSSDKIHQIVFGLPPGGVFRHSEAYRTIFAADIVYYVLAGTLVLSNPQPEKCIGCAGRSRLFPPRHLASRLKPRRGTAAGAGAFRAAAVARHVRRLCADQGIPCRPALRARRMARPLADRTRAEAASGQTIQVLRAGDLLWRMEGGERPALVGILVRPSI